MNARQRRIGLFGGSFDPVHNGHVEAARTAIAFAALDDLYFLPAAASPFKVGLMQASHAQRLDMLRLATEGESCFAVSDVEIVKSGVSYTIDTIRHFASVMPKAKLFFIIGADSLMTLHQWKDAAELVRRCEIITLARPGWDAGRIEGFDVETRDRLLRGIVRDFSCDVSSTEIRRRVAAGECISEMVHPAVCTYIQKHGLYRS